MLEFVNSYWDCSLVVPTLTVIAHITLYSFNMPSINYFAFECTRSYISKGFILMTSLYIGLLF